MELRRVLGLPGLTFYGVGVILGAGIYTIIGAAAGLAGEGLWIAFLVAAVVAALTGLSYAELATMFPRAAAEYNYLREALPRRPWAAASIGYLLAAASVSTAATVSLAFAGYFAPYFGGPPWMVAGALIVLATTLSLVGVRQSSWVNVVFTLIEVSGLVAVIAIGATHASLLPAVEPVPISGVLLAAALVFFAYLGFEDIANLAEEARDPSRTVPRALFIAIGMSTLLYVLVALAALALKDPASLAESQAPLRDALAEASPRTAAAVGGIALFATANTCLVALVVASRIVFGVARGGDLPRPLARILARRRTPWIAALLVAMAALCLLPLRRPDLIGSVASFCSLLAFAAVNASVVVLRLRRPEARRPFRVPATIGRWPVFPILGLASCVGLVLYLEPTVLMLGALAVAYAVSLRLLAGWADWAPKRVATQG